MHITGSPRAGGGPKVFERPEQQEERATCSRCVKITAIEGRAQPDGNRRLMVWEYLLLSHGLKAPLFLRWGLEGIAVLAPKGQCFVSHEQNERRVALC